MLVSSRLRVVLTPAAIAQLALGWIAFAILTALRPLLAGPLATPLIFAVLVVIVATIIVCAFGVVAQAEHLARRLGDPYGTLVLTLSIVVIEVILISAVMLGPGEHTTIARDSVMAVSMIILNLVIGAALIVGSRRHPRWKPNRTGVSAYLGLLVVLLVCAFALPAVLGTDGSYEPGQAIAIAMLTVVLYVFFLVRQMGPERTDFQEVAMAAAAEGGSQHPPVLETLRVHRSELLGRTVLLILTVIPIVLLSHDMAGLLDAGLDDLGAPVALSGLLIAMIVFLPETITTIRAALGGELQRVSNLCHGALVSTVGLTIPAVLVIGLLTGQQVLLAAGPASATLLLATLLLTGFSFLGGRPTPLHGAAHLMLFALYGIAVFV